MRNNIGFTKRKTLLYRSGVEYGDFCINHVEGCFHGCLYPCYAMLIKKRAGVISSYAEWRKPKIVSNAIQLLEKEIPKYRDKIKSVYLCFSTDPFMYKQKEVIELSLEIIRRLNNYNIPCKTLTKGNYPVDAINGDFNPENEYGITLVSLDEKFRKSYEPYSARFQDRRDALRGLHEKGFKTWVSIEPYPTPNIIKQDLLKLLESVSFVDKLMFGRLNYSPKTREFKYQKEFYYSMAKEAIEFCKRNQIRFHIKKGTLT